MIKNQKYLFLYALILTIVVFNIGIFFGYMLELSRANIINELYSNSELELLDQMAQKEALKTLDFDCDTLSKENIRFGDQIFNEALQIQKYEDANRITNGIIFQHKRFDLLRTIFWINSIEIKQKCSLSYHNVVYFYKYNNPSLGQESKQKFFSDMLQEIKQKQGDKILLIPIAIDNNLPSVNLMTEKYNITESPSILIDENKIITNVEKIEDIENYLV